MCHALVTHGRIRIISIRRQKMRGIGVVTSLFGGAARDQRFPHTKLVEAFHSAGTGPLF